MRVLTRHPRGRWGRRTVVGLAAAVGRNGGSIRGTLTRPGDQKRPSLHVGVLVEWHRPSLVADIMWHHAVRRALGRLGCHSEVVPLTPCYCSQCFE